MSNFNRVILVGRLTKDPAIKFTSKGLAVTNITLAVSRKFKGEESSYMEETTFVDVSIFGKNAEVVSKFFFKGNSILVEGRLKSDQWSSNGIKKTKLLVILESFQFTGYSNNNSSSNNEKSKGLLVEKKQAENADLSYSKNKLNENYDNDKNKETEPF